MEQLLTVRSYRNKRKFEHTTYLSTISAGAFLSACFICGTPAKIQTLQGSEVSRGNNFLGVVPTSDLSLSLDKVQRDFVILLQREKVTYLFQAQKDEIEEILKGFKLYERLLQIDFLKDHPVWWKIKKDGPVQSDMQNGTALQAQC